MKRTAIIGSTSDPHRYAYRAAELLDEKGHDIVPLGIKGGKVLGKPILDLRQKPNIGPVDTVTMYIAPWHQPTWYDYIIGMKPKRILFNPGTENEEFVSLAQKAGIETEEACTLVLLTLGNY